MSAEAIVASVTLGLQLIGIVVWGVRLEGKVNNQDQRYGDLKELINTQFDNVNGRLDRIERAMNGAIRH